MFALSGGAALFHAYAHPALLPGENAFLLAMSAGLWLVIAIYTLRDMSAQFNPALTLAFALRGDMSWRRAAAFWGALFSGGIAAVLMARSFFGVEAASPLRIPQQATRCKREFYQVFLTGVFIHLVLALTRGPKLAGNFTPLAICAYVLSFATISALYDGAAFSPASALGPAVVLGQYRDVWVYIVGDSLGAGVAVGIDRYLRGPANSVETEAAGG